MSPGFLTAVGSKSSTDRTNVIRSHGSPLRISVLLVLRNRNFLCDPDSDVSLAGF